MEIKQKKFSNKTKFSFGEEDFNYTIEDKSSSGEFSMSYADFPQKQTAFEEKNGWLKNVGLIWCAIGVLQIGNAVITKAPLSGTGFWLIIGLVCLVFYKYARTKFSMFSDNHSKIFIIKDKKHDQILDEINKRRKRQMLTWYGEINFDNEPERETNKFKWLLNEGVITKEEADTKIAQIELANRDPAPIAKLLIN